MQRLISITCLDSLRELQQRWKVTCDTAEAADMAMEGARCQAQRGPLSLGCWAELEHCSKVDLNLVFEPLFPHL